MKNYILGAHMRRMISSPALYFGIAVQALGLVLLCHGEAHAISEAIEYMAAPVYYLDLLFFLALPPLAYAMTGTDDKNTRMLYFWSIRGGADNYAVSYYITSLCSGFLMTFCGLGLGCLISAFLGCSLNVYTDGQRELAVLADVSPLLYYVARIGELAMGSMTVAGIASAAAVFFRNKVTVLTMPIILLLMLGSFFSADHMLFSKTKLILGATYAPGQLGLHLLLHLWMSVVWWIACGMITVHHIRRSV